MLKIKCFIFVFILLICGCETKTIKIESNLSIPYGYNIKKDNSIANQMLIDFPNKIPGAKSIDKFLIKDASYVLVHIKQAHLNGFSTNIQKEYIIRIQKDIYNILSFLSKNNIINIYVEGIISSIEINTIAHLEHKEATLISTEIDSLTIYINMLKNTLNNKQLMNILYQNKNDLIKKISFYKKDLNEKQERYNNYLKLKEQDIIKGSVFILASEEKVNILAFESQDGILNARIYIDKYIESYNKYMDKDFIYNIAENRENIFIKKMTSSKDPVAICVLGGLHAFGGIKSCGQYYNEKDRLSITDNIYLWNIHNSNKKISLIEITPMNY
jgi:hypothetical protein